METQVGRYLLDVLIEKWYLDCNKDKEIFYAFSLISNYITSQKLADWNNNLESKQKLKSLGGSISTLPR